MTPFEVVKTRLQVQKMQAVYSGPLDVVTEQALKPSDSLPRDLC